MEILSAASPEFREYGRIVGGCEEITAALVNKAREVYTLPESGLAYTPSSAELEAVPGADSLMTSLFGGLPVQIGCCYGRNAKMNCLEYHRDSEYNLSEEYRDLIRDCLEAGVPISAIGLQTHQHQGYMGRERLEEILERFSVFGRPLHFAENTLVSGQIMPPHIVDLNDYQVDEWPSTPEGEERQLREWKEMYEILFAHPLVEAVTGWDFADGAWLHAPSGLIREDNTEKPAYYEIQNLAKKRWTSQGTLRTDKNGFAVLEGFRGQYRLTAGGAAADVTLAKDSADRVETVTLSMD